MTSLPKTSPHGAPSRLAIGLAAYSFSYSCGFEDRGTDRAGPHPYDAYALMDIAATHNPGGIEFPPAWCLSTLEPAELEKASRYAAERNLFVVSDTGVVDIADLQVLQPVAAKLGARTLRVMVSTILCGDRRAVRDTWSAYLTEICRRLRAVRGLAEELGVAIALENHQDVTSGELVALCVEYLRKLDSRRNGNPP